MDRKEVIRYLEAMDELSNHDQLRAKELALDILLAYVNDYLIRYHIERIFRK